MTTCSSDLTPWDRNQSDWLTGTVTANVTLDAQPVHVSFDEVTFIEAEWTGPTGVTRGWQAYITPDDLPPTVIACEVVVRVQDTSGPEPVDVYLRAGIMTLD